MEFRDYCFFFSMGFKHLRIEPCLFFPDDCILCVYVDDIIIAAISTSVMDTTRQNLHLKFKLNPTFSDDSERATRPIRCSELLKNV